jgi:hypothetical protein
MASSDLYFRITSPDGVASTWFGPVSQAQDINSWEDLHNMRNDLAGNYILRTNLDENSPGYTTYGNSWIPVGDVTNGNFSGTFNGNGHSISNLIIDATPGQSQRRGLFGIISGTVSNIFLINVSFTSTPHYRGGAISGSMTAPGQIINCGATGSWEGAGYYLGGIVGQCPAGCSVTNCFYIGDLTLATYEHDAPWSGGICGENFGTVTNCYYSGNIQRAVGSPRAPGGVTGRNLPANSYYNSDLASDVDPNFGTPLTTSQMKNISSYTNWDIVEGYNTNNIWNIYEYLNNGYPFLSNLFELKYKEILVDSAQVSANLSNFPFLVKLENDTEVGAIATQSTQVRFFDEYGTLLDFDVEYFDNTAGSVNAIFWVKVPSISASVDTAIVMEYGNFVSTPVSANVWSDYKIAMQLEDDAGALVVQDKGNMSAQWTVEGTTLPPIPTAGVIGTASLVQGGSSTDCRLLTVGQHSIEMLDGIGEHTWQCWMRLESSSGNHPFFDWVANNPGFFMWTSDSGGYIGIGERWGAGSAYSAATETNNGLLEPLGPFVKVTVVRNGTNWKWYKNGQLFEEWNQGNPTTDTGISNRQLHLHSYAASNRFRGAMNQFRFSHTVQTPEWVAFEYAMDTGIASSISAEGVGVYPFLPSSGTFSITDVTDGVDRTFTVGQTGIITTGSGFGSAP